MSAQTDNVVRKKNENSAIKTEQNHNVGNAAGIYKRGDSVISNTPSMPQKTFEVSFHGNPALVYVYIDDVYMGTTFNSIELSVGTHQLKLHLDGYKDFVSSIDISETGSNQVVYEMDANKSSKELEQLRIFQELESDMIFVQGGSFTMGATREQESEAWDDEKPAHQVTLNSFYICKFEVTQELWQAVMGNEETLKLTEKKKPIFGVNYEMCIRFLYKLNSMTGKNYRLPTEAEWEYACRGGNQGRGYKYSGSNNVSDVAWFSGNAHSKVFNVGMKLPNELGLYDMSGNVWEWCSDSWGEYDKKSQINPKGPNSGERMVLRGGSCAWDAFNCRVSRRFNASSFYDGSDYGFRLALSE